MPDRRNTDPKWKIILSGYGSINDIKARFIRYQYYDK